MSSEVRLPLTSVSPNAERLDALKTLFPEAVTEGKIDFDRLKQALGESTQTGRERYSLNWAGRTHAINALQSLSVGTLQPAREESVGFDTTEHLIIEGDNLEVLKLLQKSYFGKVKMIYIDPPYNTGNEFIYPDNFREGLEDYLKFSGQMSAEGTATTSNKETNGRYHSKWLSMMYPRLFLAKNLLRDDGVIFVSIDDHEVYNLRLMMNEIFGEENFLACICWERADSPRMDADNFSVKHDYVVCYAKSIDDCEIKRLSYNGNDIPDHFNKKDEEGRRYYLKPLRAMGGQGETREARPNLYYGITAPDGSEVFPKLQSGKDGAWRWSKNKLAKEPHRIEWTQNGKEWVPYYRITADGSPGKPPETILYHQEVGSTRAATAELKALFDQERFFDTPKPVNLIKRLITIAAESGDIILDFFAGSGTTAQAVLELNKDDGGNRKVILVQLPEKTEYKQFPTIAHITRERVRRVIAKMNEADNGSLNLSDAEGQDRGFKAFRLAASHFKIWQGKEGETDAESIAQQLELFADNLLPDATPEGILFEILLKAGYDLNVLRAEITVADQLVYSIAGGEHLICLERKVARETLAGMVKLTPKSAICLDEAFHGDDALLTNTLLQMQDAGILFHTI